MPVSKSAHSRSETQLDLIKAERQCCRFFKFELIFEPYEDPIWFGVRGSAEVKKMIESMMGE